jgi:hypothetical protein
LKKAKEKVIRFLIRIPEKLFFVNEKTLSVQQTDKAENPHFFKGKRTGGSRNPVGDAPPETPFPESTHPQQEKAAAWATDSLVR